jgi:hypothetical protein
MPMMPKLAWVLVALIVTNGISIAIAPLAKTAI